MLLAVEKSVAWYNMDVQATKSVGEFFIHDLQGLKQMLPEQQHRQSAEVSYFGEYMGREAINEIGNRYGKLVVISFDKSTKGKPYWNCLCDCGKLKSVRGSHLRCGNIRSCRRCLPEGEASFNMLYAQRKRAARIVKREWKLSKDDVKEITSSNCYYCGASPAQITRGNGCNGDYIYNGMDRIDSSKGYIIGNVVPCCWDCNRAKGDTATNYFKDWVTRAYNHFVLGRENSYD